MLNLLVQLAIFGLLLYLINLIPMEATVKKILNVVAIVVIVLWVLSAFFPGSFSGFNGVHLR